MNSQYFSDSIRLLLDRQGRTENLRSADCLDAIAQCIRLIASTDPMLGAIAWSAVKLARGEASLGVARILERFATDIRLKASKKNENAIVRSRP